MEAPRSYTFSSNALKNVAIFIVAFIALGLFIQYIFEKKFIRGNKTSAAFKIYKIVNISDPNEIPIFGNSRALTSYLPSILGENYFDYGIPAIGEKVVFFFLKNECLKKKKSRSIIINLNLESVNSKNIGDKSAYIPMANNKEIRELLGKDFVFYYNIPFFKYFGNYEQYFRDYLRSSKNLTTYADNGALVSYKKGKEKNLIKMILQRENKSTTFTVDKNIADEYLSIFKKNPNRIFIFVIPPYHESFFKKFQNYPQAQAFLEQWKQIPNVRILNYSRLHFPDACYSNTSHLSYEGAVAFSNIIKDTLYKIENSIQ